MFTVCPKCALTLVVTAADLRVAQGYVRCGRCSNVFNAIVGLSEDGGRRPASAGSQRERAPRPRSSARRPRSVMTTRSRTPARPKPSTLSRSRAAGSEIPGSVRRAGGVREPAGRASARTDTRAIAPRRPRPRRLRLRRPARKARRHRAEQAGGSRAAAAL